MILVVDDNPQVLEVLGEVLRGGGHQVETTTSSRQALEWVGARPYELIVSDMEMPGLDGIGLYRAVADRSPTLARRFIFITGSSHTPEVRAFVERTQVRLLSKPFNVDQLRRVVQEVLTA